MSSSHPSQIGRYQIQRLIGAGGMGDVFLARDPNIERQLAIKTVRLRGAPAEVADHKMRLLREAKAAGRLVHANVVTLFDAGEADGLLYLAFEFVDGPDLGRRMKTPPPLTLRHALTLVRQIAEGLSIAHHQGIIHRDIKPSNILIDPRGQAKIADFGLAKMNDESVELTRSGSVVGSPQYMSPEQVRGETLDGRTDIFSLGVLFYELMSSMRPFGGQTISTLVYEILSKEPPALGQLRPDLPPGIAELVQGMLAKELPSRTTTADEVVHGLDQVLASTPEAMLDAPAVTPVDANAPTELMARTPTPHQAAAHPPAASHTMAAGGSAIASMPPPPPTLPMPTAAAAGVPAMPPLPPRPPTSAEAPTTGSQGVPPASSQAAVTATTSKSSGKVWILAAVGGFFLLCLAVGVWQLGRMLGDKTDGGETTVAATTPPESGTATTAAGDEPGVGGDGGSGDVPDAASASQPVAEQPGNDLASVPTDGVEDPGAGNPGAGTAPPSTTAEPTPAASEVQPPPRQTQQVQPPPPPRQSPPPPAPTQQAPTQQAPSQTTPPPDQAPPEGSSVDSAVAKFDAAAGQAQREMNTGRFFKFMVEPEDAVVRLWRRGEERQVVLGQAKGYSAKDRDGRSVELPEDGDYLFTFIADGVPNFMVLVHATNGRGLGAQVIRASLKESVQGSKNLRVSRSLAFNGFPEDAQVIVDGVPRGPASKWPGGMRANGPRNLQLKAGRHRIRLEADGYEPHEILVEVAPGARRSATVRYDLRRSN